MPKRKRGALGLSGGSCDGYMAVAIKIASSPPTYEDDDDESDSDEDDPAEAPENAYYRASHLLNDNDRSWCSRTGERRNLSFIFEAHQPCILARFEWKGTGTGCDPAKLCLEAECDEAWARLSVWDAQTSYDWQSHEISLKQRSQKWKLTLLENHGDTQWMTLAAVRFIAQPAQHAGSLGARLWAERAFADVEVIVGERRFPAHRAVLAAASPVLSAMLHTDMQEARTGEIRLEDTDERCVHAALEYMYTGVLSERAHFGVVLLANKYDIKGLMAVAAPVALQNVTVDNVVTALRTLKGYAGDPSLGVVWKGLLERVGSSSELLAAAMLELL